ncbi:MAG: tRNA (adenosine(37)-N6)-threonylcarbamoyltransferase complex dimerization subunit type 1 TsaB [Caldisericia bacterium]|jgi:tRNA threonylcarbamoyladenosine biosynthesis protein TsaB|nr:tRNA (adenosine(37)-N6)-threonylcarbamoyltransferase complex dimerization subunit type 1 TsaB [Caldisericia bacterium]
MLQISLNTAIEPYGISLLEDEKLLSEYTWSFSDTGKNDHITGLDFLLKNLNKKINDINFLTILSGPGSFTGLRIGFTFAKTINYLFKIPIVTVDAFEVLQEKIKVENYLIVINAGLKELFLFKENDIKIVKQSELIEISKESLIIFPEYYLFKEFGIGIYLNIDTYTLGKVGFKKFKKGEVIDYKNLVPLYLREIESIFKKYKT